MALRPYQDDAFEKIIKGFVEYDRQLGVAPTGCGKTIIFCALARHFHNIGQRTLILCHREELVQQAADKLFRSTGLEADVDKAESYADHGAPVVVGSIQTLMRGKRRERWAAEHFGLIITDEAHHALADSWQTVLAHFKGKVLGVTATPDRGDKRCLGKYFENIAFEISLLDLIKEGWLARIIIKSVPLKINLNSVAIKSGDYDAVDLGGVLAPYLAEIAKAVREHCSFKKTLVFLPLIATSKAFVECLRRVGVCAEHIDGDSPDRVDILRRYHENKIDVLCNAMLLTEGYDEESIESIVPLRCTKSRSLYAQMCGRGTRGGHRVSQTKLEVLLLDFLWQHEKHSLIKPAHLIAQTEEHAEAITKIIEDLAPGGGEDLIKASNTAREDRERKLRLELAAKAHRAANTVDAMEYCLSVGAAQITDYEPTMAWEGKDVSAGQATFLRKLRINPESVKSRGLASKIIDVVIQRSKLGLATAKQVEFLRKNGHPSPETATFKEATAWVNERWHKK
jgi:superfamily II DNA or RNA helicase